MLTFFCLSYIFVHIHLVKVMFFCEIGTNAFILISLLKKCFCCVLRFITSIAGS